MDVGCTNVTRGSEEKHSYSGFPAHWTAEATERSDPACAELRARGPARALIVIDKFMLVQTEPTPKKRLLIVIAKKKNELGPLLVPPIA